MPTNPRQQLPIAPCPTVLPGCGNLRMGRKFFKKFDIANQCATHVYALEQVVAELGVVRHSSDQRSLKGVYMIQAFAAVSAEREKVLIKLGHRTGIGIRAGCPCKNLMKH